MPKGTKEPTSTKSVYVKFTTEEDLDLYAHLEEQSKLERRDLATYILLQLLEAIAVPTTPTSAK
jgi:hypothetical protein